MLVVVLLVVAAAGATYIKKRVADEIARALGSHAHYSAIEVSVDSIRIRDVAIDAKPGWPEAEELTAKEVLIVPRLASLIRRDPVEVSDIVVSDGHAVLVREKGGLDIFPVLLRQGQPHMEHPDQAPLAIDHVRLLRMSLNFYDRTVTPRDFKIHLEPVAGTLAGYTEPTDQSHLQISFAAPVINRAGAPSGDFSIAGTVSPHHGSDLQAELESVDLSTLAPYVAKAGDTGIAAGQVSLSVHSVVEEKTLTANGVINLHNLQVASSDSVTGEVLGLPRRAVIDSLKNKHGDVVLHFSLNGNVEDPKFSLNEALSTRLSAGLADALGLPMDALAKGVSGLGEQGLDLAAGIGDAVKHVLTPDEKSRAQSR